jgi:hypothetical protein
MLAVAADLEQACLARPVVPRERVHENRRALAREQASRAGKRYGEGDESAAHVQLFGMTSTGLNETRWDADGELNVQSGPAKGAAC